MTYDYCISCAHHLYHTSYLTIKNCTDRCSISCTDIQSVIHHYYTFTIGMLYETLRNCTLTNRPRQLSTVFHKFIRELSSFWCCGKNTGCCSRSCFYYWLFYRFDRLSCGSCTISFSLRFCCFPFGYQSSSFCRTSLLLLNFPTNSSLNCSR